MPSYTVRDKETDETHDVIMSWARLQEYLSENPTFVQVIGAPALVDPYAVGRMKTDNDFRENMKRIQKANPGNKIITGNLSEV